MCVCKKRGATDSLVAPLFLYFVCLVIVIVIVIFAV